MTRIKLGRGPEPGQEGAGMEVDGRIGAARADGAIGLLVLVEGWPLLRCSDATRFRINLRTW